MTLVVWIVHNVVLHRFFEGSNILSKLVDLLVAVPYSLGSMSDGNTGIDLLFTLNGLVLLVGGFTGLQAYPLSFEKVVCPCATMTASS